MSCNYKTNIKDIQSKYTFKIFCAGDTSQIEQEIGNLSDLTTTAKSNLVSAINEVDGELSAKEDKSNKVTTITSSSTDTQYPSAKAVYDSQETQNETISTLETNLEETKEELDYYKTIYNVLPKVEGNGESITLDNTGESILKMSLYGQCKQDGEPTPDYPQQIHEVSGDNEIVVCNRNLWDEDWEVGGIAWATGQNSSENDRIRSKNYIRVNGNALYNFTSLTSSAKFVWCYDKDKNIIPNVSGNNNFIQLTDATSVSFTTPLNCYYIRFIMWTTYGTTYNNDICINISDSQDGTYTPHQSQTYPINLGELELCKIGTYEDFIFPAINGNSYYDSLTQAQKDLLTYGSWYVHKEIGKVVLDDSKEWKAISMINCYGYYYLQTNILAPATAIILGIGLCNYYSIVTPIENWGTTSGDKNFTINNSSSTSANIRFCNGETTNELETFKDWISNNNVVVYYVLATPEETPIPTSLQNQLNAIEKALSKDGQTNISQVNNDAPFKIYATALKEIE